MANIVVEGADNSGKSTLIRYLSKALGMPIVQSAGPVKDLNDFRARCHQLKSYHSAIFDRHSIVSELAYGRYRPGGARVDMELCEFWHKAPNRPIFVYCQAGDKSLDGHQTREVDTQEHINLVQRHHTDIIGLYEIWARNYADVWYCKADAKPASGETIETAVNRAGLLIASQLRFIANERELHGIFRPAPGYRDVPREVRFEPARPASYLTSRPTRVSASVPARGVQRVPRRFPASQQIAPPKDGDRLRIVRTR